MKYIFDYIHRGQTPNYVEKSNCKVVNQSTFSKFFFDRDNQKFTTDCRYNDNFIRKKDVLMASTGGGVLGKVFYYDLDYNDSIADSHVTILRATNKIESKFYYYTLSILFDWINNNLAEGSTNQTELQRDLLGNSFFPLPPLATQTLIATYLDAKCSEIDGLIADINKQIETLNELKKSTITEAVTKGLNKNAKLKDSGIQWIGMIPEGWSITKLKYIFDYIRRGQTPNYVEKSNCRVVNQATFSKFYFDREKQKYTANCVYNENFVRKKDVLMASTGGGVLGKVFYYNLDYNDSIADSHVTILRTTNNIESKFYFYTLSILFEWINVNLAEGSTNQTELQRDLLGNSFYPVPPLAEQHAIATYLDTKCSEFDSIISDKQKQISTLEAYKKSLINEYVTGKNVPPVIDN